MRINKKYIVDGQGNPREVIISYEDFREIEELLGLDSDENAVSDLRQAGNKNEYFEPDSV